MISTPYIKNLIQAHYYQGDTNDCGPFSAAIILRALDRTALDGWKLSKQMRAIRWRGILPSLQRIPNWATFPWGVTNFVREYGLSATWKLRQNNSSLIRALRQGDIPITIIGEWNPLWAHYIILVARDENLGWGVIDPGHYRAEIIWKQPSVFDRLWKNYGRTLITVYP